MEEQKSKEVKMNPVNKQGNDKQSELTREQLKDIADKLWDENKYLKYQLQQAQEFVNTVNRLDYLFKVIEVANKQGKYNFTSDFVETCIGEIQGVLTIPEQKKEDNKEN
jgi:predicted RNA-binding protein with EMAP domain